MMRKLLGFFVGGVLLLIIALPFLTLNCHRIEYSRVLEEDAIVVDVGYTPPRHGSDVAPGFDTDGDFSITFVEIDIEEVYFVVFKCQHGKFVIYGKELWDNLDEQDTVIVLYREVYKVKDDRAYLVDYDFLNVIKGGKKILAVDRYNER